MKERVCQYVVVAIAVIFIAPFIKAQVGATLFIPGDGTGPALTSNIPNQAWATNTNLLNAFNLDDYFLSSFQITYNYTVVPNITVTITETTGNQNETAHLVSFYPDTGFSGIRTIRFSAEDISGSTLSNIVTLNVTEDTKPPQWSSPSQSNSEPYQNDFVNFSASWTDNVQLSKHRLTMNQGGGWVNYSQTSFSGQSNTSTQQAQISAAGGTVVYWAIIGYDSSDNINITEVRNFTVATLPTPPPGGGGGGGGSSSGSSSSSSSSGSSAGTGAVISEQGEEITEFAIEPVESFNLELKQGSSTTITIKLTNTGNSILTFSLDTEGLELFDITISDDSFELEPGQAKSVSIEFRSGELLPPDIYYGLIKVSSEIGSKDILVAITVKPTITELDITTNVLTKQVRPGQTVRANVTIENLQDITTKNLDIYYAVTDFHGNTIISETEQITFDSRIRLFEKELVIPEGTVKGDYIFLTRTIDGETTVIGSDDFLIQERFTLAAFLRDYYIYVLIAIMALTGAMILVRQHQNKERIRLLNLYLMVSEMKKLIKQEKYDEATSIYIRIKTIYGEPLSQTALKNKEELKKEMQAFAGKLDLKALQKQAEEVNAQTESPPQQGEADKSKEKPEEEKSAEKMEKKEDSSSQSSEKDEAKPKKEKSEDETKSDPIVKEPTKKDESEPKKEKNEPEQSKEKPKKESGEKKVNSQKSEAAVEPKEPIKEEAEKSGKEVKKPVEKKRELNDGKKD